MWRLHHFSQSIWVLKQRFSLQIQIAIISYLRFVSFLLRYIIAFDRVIVVWMVVMFFCCNLLGWLEEFGGALWQYLPQHSNYSWSIFGSRWSTYTAHIYNLFHRRLGGRLILLNEYGYAHRIWPFHLNFGTIGTHSKRVWGEKRRGGSWNHTEAREKIVSWDQFIYYV